MKLVCLPKKKKNPSFKVNCFLFFLSGKGCGPYSCGLCVDLVCWAWAFLCSFKSMGLSLDSYSLGFRIGLLKEMGLWFSVSEFWWKMNSFSITRKKTPYEKHKEEEEAKKKVWIFIGPFKTYLLTKKQCYWSCYVVLFLKRAQDETARLYQELVKHMVE